MRKIINMVRTSSKFNKILLKAIVLVLFLYVFSIPSFGSRGKWTFVVYICLSFLALLTTAYTFLYERRTFNKWTLPIPFFTVFSLLGTLIYSHEYRNWLTLVFLCVSFYILLYTFSIISNKDTVLIVLTIALFGFSCYFILVYRKELLNFSNYTNGSFRLGSYFDNPNGVSAFSVIGFMISLYLILFYKRKIKYLFLLPLFSLLVVGISTGSRTFIVAVLFILLILSFFKFKKHLFIYFVFLGILVIVVSILFSLPFMENLRDRFIRIFWTFFTDSARVDTSAIERVLWLEYGFYLGNKHLLTGLGVNGFGIFSGVLTYTHSNISEVWCDFGLVGFVLFYSPPFICLFSGLKNKNRNISLIICVVAYYMLISFANVYYYTKFYFFNLAILYYVTFYTKFDKSNIYAKKLSNNIRNIVFTCDGLGFGGAERTIVTLSNSFFDLGFNVTIIGVSSHNSVPSYDLKDGVRFVTVYGNRQKRIRAVKRVFILRKLLKKLKPDAIISFLPHVNVYTYFATIGFKCPIIVSERNNPLVDPKRKMIRKLKKLSFIQADGVVFQTFECRDFFRKSIRNKSIIIKNPIDDKLLNIKSSVNKNNVVLSVGRLEEQKNFKCLIEAFKLFHDRHQNYILRIYGEGSLRSELLCYIENKHLSHCVEILNNNSSWHILEKDDAMFVLSSNYEGMPNSLIEAMIVGIPPVSTNCLFGPKELIRDGLNGYLCEVDDYYDMYKKMELILNNKDIRVNEEFINSILPRNVSQQWIDYIKLTFERKYLQ